MVVDTRYYDILQIKTDADELTVKKVLSFHFRFPLRLILSLFCRHIDAKLFWYATPCLTWDLRLLTDGQHHPDKNPHPAGSPEAEAVTRKFQEVIYL